MTESTGAQDWRAVACLTPGGERLRVAAAAVGMPLQVVALDQPDVNALYARRLVRVRPDGHVAWRADTEPDDAHAIIDRVRGVLPPAEANAIEIAS